MSSDNKDTKESTSLNDLKEHGPYNTTNLLKVYDFMKTAGQATPTEFDVSLLKDDKLVANRISYITEELKETRVGFETRNYNEVADGIADLLYVIYGTCVAFCLSGSLKNQGMLGKTNYEFVRDYITECEHKPVPAVSNDKPNDKQNIKPDIKLLDNVSEYKKHINRLETELSILKTACACNNKDDTQKALLQMIFSCYEIAVLYGLNADKIFDMVHTSNMTKFCKTETQAQKTVEWYVSQFKEGKTKYKSPSYRYNNGLYVVYNKDDSKILKNIDYIPVKFDYGGV